MAAGCQDHPLSPHLLSPRGELHHGARCRPSALPSRLPPAALPPPAPSHTGTTLAQHQAEHSNSRLPNSRLSKLSGPCRFSVPAGNCSKDNWYFVLVSSRLYLNIPKQPANVSEDSQALCQHTWTGEATRLETQWKFSEFVC